MARQRKTFIYVSIMALITFVLFFAQMLFVGAGVTMSLAAAALMAVLTGMLGAASYGYREFLQRRAFSGKKQVSDNLEAHQTRTVEIDMPFDKAFDLTLDALKMLDDKQLPLPDDILVKMESILPRKQHLKIRETDREMGTIQAGLRGKTLGLPDFWDFSKINIQLQRLDNQTTRIRIESQNNIPNEIYDLGKNLHYVNEIALFLRRESQQIDAESRLADTESDDATDVSDVADSIGRASQDSKTDNNQA